VNVTVNDTEGVQYPYFLTNPSFSANGEDMTGGTNPQPSSYGTIYSFEAGYTPGGNLAQFKDSVMGTWSFSYDAVDRLMSATPGAGVPSRYAGMLGCWVYDTYGNRTLEAFSTGACTNPTHGISVAPWDGSASHWVVKGDNFSQALGTLQKGCSAEQIIQGGHN